MHELEKTCRAGGHCQLFIVHLVFKNNKLLVYVSVDCVSKGKKGKRDEKGKQNQYFKLSGRAGCAFDKLTKIYICLSLLQKKNLPSHSIYIRLLLHPLMTPPQPSVYALQLYIFFSIWFALISNITWHRSTTCWLTLARLHFIGSKVDPWIGGKIQRNYVVQTCGNYDNIFLARG